MLFLKLEILSVSYSLTIFFLGTSLRTCLSRVASACCSQTLQTFSTRIPSFSVFLFVFDDLSAAMKSSRSRVELSSSCSSSPFVACFPPKSRKIQLESLGYLLLSFVLFVHLRTFPLNVFQSFLPETFWRSKQIFELSGPDNEIDQS